MDNDHVCRRGFVKAELSKYPASCQNKMFEENVDAVIKLLPKGIASVGSSIRYPSAELTNNTAVRAGIIRRIRRS